MMRNQVVRSRVVRSRVVRTQADRSRAVRSRVVRRQVVRRAVRRIRGVRKALGWEPDRAALQPAAGLLRVGTVALAPIREGRELAVRVVPRPGLTDGVVEARLEVWPAEHPQTADSASQVVPAMRPVRLVRGLAVPGMGWLLLLRCRSLRILSTTTCRRGWTRGNPREAPNRFGGSPPGIWEVSRPASKQVSRPDSRRLVSGGPRRRLLRLSRRGRLRHRLRRFPTYR